MDVWILEKFTTLLGDAAVVGPTIDVNRQIRHPNLPSTESAYTATFEGVTLVLYEDSYGEVLKWSQSQWNSYTQQRDDQINSDPTFVPEKEYIFLEPAAADGSPPTVYVTGVRAIADTYEIDSSADAWELDVTENDQFFGDATFASLSFQQPEHGSLTLSGDRTLVYVPNENFAGLDQFRYTVMDSNGASSFIFVTLLVENDGNSAPVARDDAFEIPAGQASTFFVWDNDDDPDGDQIGITRVVPAPGELGTPDNEGFVQLLDGKVRLNDDGSVTFVPNAGFTGETFFTYEIEDEFGANDIARVDLTLVEGLEQTEAVDDFIGAAHFDGEYYFFNVRENDTIANGAIQLSSLPFTLPQSGQLETNSTISFGPLTDGDLGSFRYRPEEEFVGSVTFTYTIEDSSGTTDSAVVTIDVAPNLPPIAEDYLYPLVRSGPPGTEYEVLGVLDFVTDPEGQAVVLTEDVHAEFGDVFLDNGKLVYVPLDEFFGTDTIVYEVTDPAGATDKGTITVQVLHKDEDGDGVEDWSVAPPGDDIDTEQEVQDYIEDELIRPDELEARGWEVSDARDFFGDDPPPGTEDIFVVEARPYDVDVTTGIWQLTENENNPFQFSRGTSLTEFDDFVGDTAASAMIGALNAQARAEGYAGLANLLSSAKQAFGLFTALKTHMEEKFRDLRNALDGDERFDFEAFNQKIEDDARKLQGDVVGEIPLIGPLLSNIFIYSEHSDIGLRISNGSFSTISFGHSDRIFMGDSDDYFDGQDKDDVLFGRGGDDLLVGGDGNDILDGGPGSDLIIGEIGNDDIHGGDDRDFLYGESGDDYLSGGNGDDLLLGGGGNDHLFDGSDADFLDGDEGHDTIFLTGSTYHTSGYVAFNVSSETQVGTQARVNLEGLVRIEAVADGGAGADIVQLSDEGDAFFLHDAYSGFHGSVELNEDHYGNMSFARLANVEEIRGMGGNDLIDLTSPDYSFAGAFLTIDGGDGNDTIWGSDANETIYGGPGNDIIFAGIGTDLVYGGQGADRFEITATSDGLRIADFNPAEGDTIRFYNTDGYEVLRTDSFDSVFYNNSTLHMIVDSSETRLFPAIDLTPVDPTVTVPIQGVMTAFEDL